MISTSHRRWLGAASIAAAAALAPQTAQASDDFAVYDSRAQFEAALGTSHTTTPGASGVTFTTSGVATSPTYYAAGQSGNLFGGSAASVGYTGVGSLHMSLPSGLSAFGFDYRYTPKGGFGEATFEGQFCTTFIGTACHEYESRFLTGGSGFIGIVANSGVQYATITGLATNVQVANLTFAGAVTTTPEPATVALLGSGIAALAGFGALRRRRQSVES